MSTLWATYQSIPIVTRLYTTFCVLTSIALQLDLVSPFQLYFNPDLVFRRFQIWRLVTCFFYFGKFGLNFILNLVFTYRYCRSLEEVSFHNRPADFIVLFAFGWTLMILISLFTDVIFMGSSFTIMLVYVWSRRNAMTRINIFGLITLSAPYLPWFLLGFQVLTGRPFALDLIGIAVGHTYYFLEYIFPYQQGGYRILKAPAFLERLFDPNGSLNQEARFLS
ncbi:hypothetical protein GJ496_006548 [Pomphorhynchus laevis]|nr:hypothetical protein GJ496_006548 [Pomphorhynchus laevis]